MAAGEAAAGTAEPPGGGGGGGGGGGSSSSSSSSSSSTERALAEAASSGTLSLAGRRLRSFPAGAAERWDLSDVTQADLSRNRLSEVPPAACRLPALEWLSLSHNALRRLPPALAELRALTQLDLSHNQLRALPSSLCLLPLRVLLASHNHLARLPDNVGALGSLCQLDVSCNELRALPPAMGQLRSLRDLNLRHNRLTALPPELSALPLVHLDFSCNRIVSIPGSFRRLRHLQSLLTDHNPLQSPPAQLCLKGRIHIFKHLEASSSPPLPPPCPTDDLLPLRRRRGLDSGFNSVDSGSKRWSGNESTEEFAEPTRTHRERRNGGDSDPEPLDFSEGCEDDEDSPNSCVTPKIPPKSDNRELISQIQQNLQELLLQDLGDTELLRRLARRLCPPSPTPPVKPPTPPFPPPGLLAAFGLFYALLLVLLRVLWGNGDPEI